MYFMVYFQLTKSISRSSMEKLWNVLIAYNFSRSRFRLFKYEYLENLKTQRKLY
jgi:hypothetical protein